MQAWLERESAEMIAAENIQWRFAMDEDSIIDDATYGSIDRHEAYSALILEIPRQLISFIRKHTFLTVLIEKRRKLKQKPGE